jgi:hypothetical protein
MENSIMTNEAQAQEVLALIPASFQQAFNIKLEWREESKGYSLLVHECSTGFCEAERVRVSARHPYGIELRCGNTSVLLYLRTEIDMKFYIITII